MFLLAWPNSSVDPLQYVANFELMEEFTLAASRQAPEHPPSRQVRIKTLDGVFSVDLIDVSNGAPFLRARGIQYAEHPVGELRWQPPVPKKPDFQEVLSASSWGDDCVQGDFMRRISSIRGDSMSESCLYLNVWAPYNATSERTQSLPVLVWIHGGGFKSGGSSNYQGDGIFLHRHDAVLVTVNYRLGALGFLGGSTVAKSTVDGSSGNFGLQDTRLALKWVQRNIGSFGGDPQRVTIFGESAGASLVATHLSAHRSNGLFKSAIMQSGAFYNYNVQSDAEATFASLASITGCEPGKTANVMECLRKIPIWHNETGTDGGLMPALSAMNVHGGPCIDGVELVESPEKSARSHRLNNFTSAIIGTTRDEGRYLMPAAQPVGNGPQATLLDFHAWLQRYYPGAVDEITKQYSKELNTLSPWETAAAIYTDSQYLCPTQRSARWLSDIGVQAYVYRLEFKAAVFDVWSKLLYQELWCTDLSRCENVSMVDPGVGHSADVYLLFGDSHMNQSELSFGLRMVDYWMNFAGSGNPSDGNAAVPTWPAYLPGNTTLALRPKSALSADLRLSYCEFWEQIDSGNVPHVVSRLQQPARQYKAVYV
jgi:para-nitrobenzyl esterase